MTKLNPKCTTCQTKSLSLFSNCCDEILEEISENKTFEFFKKGDQLLKEGEETKGIFCIRSGVAKAEAHKNGNSLILRLEGKGAVVGRRVMGKKDKEPISVTAVENMQVCHLTAEKFHSLYSRCQGLQTGVMKSLLAEMQNVEKHVLSLVYNTVKQRVAGVLLQIAEIYHYKQGSCSIHVHLDRQDIADLAGTTKEQVSVALSELREAKLVNFKAKHFKFFDLDGLKRLAESD